MKRLILMTVAVSLFFGSGCTMVKNSMRDSEKISMWNPIEAIKPAAKEDEEPNPPQSMAAIWNFGVYEKAGSPSIRGLGGRIYFYDKDSKPVPAHGELIVYGFDEESGSNAKPDKKFVFRDTEFQSHYSESALGGSYSVWVPWDKVGGFRKSVVLIPIFKTTDGNVLKSGQSINLLAGRVRKTAESSSNEPYKVLGSSSAVLGQPGGERKKASTSGVTQASFDEGDSDQDSNPNGDFRQRIRTTAISLTPNLQRQIEISKRLRAGEKVFGDSKTTPAGAATQQNSKVQPQNSVAPQSIPQQRPATLQGKLEVNSPAEPEPKSTTTTQSNVGVRTSTTSGIFGAPGTVR